MSARPSRDAVLRAVGRGGTTAEIAALLQCSPSAATRQLQKLKAAGELELVMAEKRRLEWQRKEVVRT